MLLSNCKNSNTNIASIVFDGTNIYSKDSVATITEFRDKLRAEETGRLTSGIQHIYDNLSKVQDVLVLYTEYHWIARMFMLVLLNLCLFLLISGVLTMRRTIYFPALRLMTSYVILPCTILLLILTWIVTALISTFAIMNSGT